TIDHNSAYSIGGGIYNPGTLLLTNSTIANNSATLNGGGILNAGTMKAVNCTIAYNQIAASYTGGGLYAGAGMATLDNTIVDLNLSGTSPDDIFANGGNVSGAYNLIGTGGSGGLTNGINGNQVGVANPGLAAALADNGGPTQTIALLPGSPATDKGSNALAVDPTTGQPLTTDQRGTGFPRIVNNIVDIGAYELTVNQAPAITSANSAAFTVGTAGSFTVTTTGSPTPSLSETGALPSGVTFVAHSDGTATLSGTPAAGAGGTYPLTFTAHNGVGSDATQSFTLTVNQAPAITSANSAAFTVG